MERAVIQRDGTGTGCERRRNSRSSHATPLPDVPLQAAIEFLPIACFLLTAAGVIRTMNTRARQMIKVQPQLSVCGDHLIVKHPKVAEQLDAAIRDCGYLGSGASGAAAKTFIPMPRTRQLPLLFWAAPFDAHRPAYQANGDTWVALFCHDPEYRVPLSEVYLREAYGMTRAEARIGALLATGHSTVEIAAATGTTVNAVRFHVKSINAKTGTHRRSEIVARILRNAVYVCDGYR